MTKVGEVTGSVTPSARHAPRIRVVFPAPSSPLTSTRSPGASVAANLAPSASVSSGPAVRSSKEIELVGFIHGARRDRLPILLAARQLGGDQLLQAGEVAAQRLHQGGGSERRRGVQQR